MSAPEETLPQFEQPLPSADSSPLYDPRTIQMPRDKEGLPTVAVPESDKITSENLLGPDRETAETNATLKAYQSFVTLLPGASPREITSMLEALTTFKTEEERIDWMRTVVSAKTNGQVTPSAHKEAFQPMQHERMEKIANLGEFANTTAQISPLGEKLSSIPVPSNNTLKEKIISLFGGYRRRAS